MMPKISLFFAQRVRHCILQLFIRRNHFVFLSIRGGSETRGSNNLLYNGRSIFFQFKLRKRCIRDTIFFATFLLFTQRPVRKDEFANILMKF